MGKLKRLGTVLITFSVLTFCLKVESNQEKPHAKVRFSGVVLDPNEARIPNALVTVEGEGTSTTVATKDVGEFALELQEGVYRISVEVPNYYPYRRSAFQLLPGDSRTMRVLPVLRILSVGLEVTDKGVTEPVKTASSPRYESFPYAFSSNRLLDVLVQFKAKERRGNLSYYRDAVVTHDWLRISAQRIHLNKRAFIVQGEGKVTIDNGSQVVRATRVIANLRTRELKVTLD